MNDTRTYPVTTLSIVMYDGAGAGQHMPERSAVDEFPDTPQIFGKACVPSWDITALWPLTWFLFP